MRPLPMSLAENGGRPVDVLLVTGDAYVDHPGWGVAAIGRWLEAHGFSVGVIAQPDPDDPEALRALGRPRLFVGVTAGNMDSMVNAMTASRRRRRTDAYTPGGRAGRRPDRATIPYTAAARRALPGVPVVLGGIEASLRRLAHYDWWQDRVRGSILLDAKADLLVYGMGERAVVEIARRLAAGRTPRDCRDIPGVAWATGGRETPPADAVELPALDEVRRDPLAFNRMTVIAYREANPACGRRLVQRHGGRWLVVNPPAEPLSTAELDRLHELPFTRRPHPSYREPIPALASIGGTITANRGCAGGCSFCALTIHQGKDVVSRSVDSVAREARAIARDPRFNGIITDVGGPTANLTGLGCTSPEARAVCRRPSCLWPTRCKHFGTDHATYLRMLRAVRSTPGVRRVYVNSGIRTDVAGEDPRFVEELARHHVQGQLSVAPEHASPAVLRAMKKPAIEGFEAFARAFQGASHRAGREQYLVPYFQAGHPGTGPAEAVELALWMKAHGYRPRQVQLFMPTPGTLATAMWVSGRDPHGNRPLPVARGDRERSRQRALLLYWKREEWPHVREALRAWGRADLIGRGPEHLVPPGPAWGAWQRRGRRREAEPAADRGACLDAMPDA